jgi:hypothetical protein
MPNFSIGTQLDNELKKFQSDKVKLAAFQPNETVRFLKGNPSGYFFNQQETISLIDLYYNSKFENGEKDTLNQRKVFLNIGKFRTDVASKQIDIDTKDFKFIPDDYADPWTAIFLQKDFKEWAKDSYFGELVNECVDALPKYGSVVLKKVGKKIEFVPLQNLRNEQTAKNLQVASYVIEEHPDMFMWEMQAMKGWNTDGLKLKYNQPANVFERYGRVPLGWLHKQNGIVPTAEDWNTSTDAMVIMCKVEKDALHPDGVHVFFAESLNDGDRPYREAHWNKQHGRWLGVGVMEDLIENQVASNVGINLTRRSLHWSAKRLFQSQTTSELARNLATSVKDGDVIEIGANGEIKQIDLTQKSGAEIQNFINTFSENANQKSFAYDVITGSMASHTPYRLAIILANAVASYYALKKQKLGLFLKDVAIDFLVPDFLNDMGNKDRVVMMFSGEAGFEVLKAASMEFIKSELTRVSLLSGKPVDAGSLQGALGPYMDATSLPFTLTKQTYKEAKFKFDLNITGEAVNPDEKVKTLTLIYQSMVQQGDPRAEKVLQRIVALQGESMSEFGPAPQPVAPAATAADTAEPQLSAAAQGQQGNAKATATA